MRHIDKFTNLFIAILILLAIPLHSKQCVILLHGLARSSKSMQELSHYLNESGYKTLNVDYESTKHPIDSLSSDVLSKSIKDIGVEDCEKIHFVTHSLGGILVRKYFSEKPFNKLGRVVMLGPPNQGSEVVDHLKDWSLFKLINGPAGNELGTDSSSVPINLDSVHFELGIIAGDRSINWINSLMINGPDDGKVSVERTKVMGMKDHIVIHTTHPMMMNNKEVMIQIVHFLRNGHFNKPKPVNSKR